MNKLFKGSLNSYKLRILNRLGFLNNRILIEKASQYGKTRYIPIIDGTGLGEACGSQTEKWVYQILNKLNTYGPIDVFLDIGVNTGQTLLKIMAINPSVSYIGFEPNPNCLFYVDYMIRLNKFSNTKLIGVALGDKNEFLSLNFEGSQDTRATLLQSSEIRTKLIYSKIVPVIPLDEINLCIQNDSFIVMKIDVEGFELEALRGAENFINKHKPVIIFEVLPHHLDDHSFQKQESILAFLNTYNYAIFLIRKDCTLELIKEFRNIDDYSNTDYIAVTDDHILQHPGILNALSAN